MIVDNISSAQSNLLSSKMGLPLVLATIALGVSLYYYVNRKKSLQSIEKFRAVCDQLDYASQSSEVKQDGGLVRVSKYAQTTGKEIKYASYFFSDCKTLYDVLPRGSRQSNDGHCLGGLNKDKTKMEWIRYSAVLKRTKWFSDGLLVLGLAPKDTFGIYSTNSPEYSLAEYGCYRHSMIVIPIYETLGSNIAAFIAKEATLQAIFCDTLTRVEAILKNIKEFEFLKHIIVSAKNLDHNQNGADFEVTKAKVKDAGLSLWTISDVEKLGMAKPCEDHPPAPEDLAVICYTSGTTDAPKGVMLTHENIVANFSGILHHLMDYRLDHNDTLISFLPLGHMFERISEAGVLCVGGRIGYFSGDIRRITDDLKIIKPTMFPCVPRILNKMYSKIYENVSGSQVKSWILDRAYQAKRKQYANRIWDNNTIWDYLVFYKIRALLGGRVRLIPVGSAPINGKVLDFMRCALGCHILEGYGQTESTAALAVTMLGDFTTGHVGVPLNTVSVKLVDVPEMNYFVAEGKGEICVKGPIVFKGYFKNDNKTSEVLSADKWLYTGDVGMWNENGTLKIIDRKKDIFKLAQGEYIAPAKIEDVYAQSPYILQIFVYGDSYKSSLVGILVPNFVLIQETLRKQGKGVNIDFNNNDQLRDSPIIKHFLMQELSGVAKMSKLKSFEQVKDICIYPEGWTIEQQLLTPTLKNKRFALKKYFQKHIQELYHNRE